MAENPKTVYMGSDHAGYDLKNILKKYLTEKGTKVIDLGCFSADSVDYPDIAREVGEKIIEEKNAVGILICGTGIGMMMAANKLFGVRAAACPLEIMAKMARLHNDANILCLGSRIIDEILAEKIVDIFLETEFENEERHKRRIEKMMAMHKGSNEPVPPEDKDDCC
jgi:ribose 5-phosphate isomerase B